MYPDFYADINASAVLIATHAIALVVGLVAGAAFSPFRRD